MADDDTVCISPDGKATGGSAIFDDFRKHRQSTTTISPPSTTPGPTPNEKVNRLYFALFVLCLIATIFSISLNAFLLKKLMPTRNNYEQIPNPETPYQDTVRDITEE